MDRDKINFPKEAEPFLVAGTAPTVKPPNGEPDGSSAHLAWKFANYGHRTSSTVVPRIVGSAARDNEAMEQSLMIV